jgi:hypothetical protein
MTEHTLLNDHRFRMTEICRAPIVDAESFSSGAHGRLATWHGTTRDRARDAGLAARSWVGARTCSAHLSIFKKIHLFDLGAASATVAAVAVAAPAAVTATAAAAAAANAAA